MGKFGKSFVQRKLGVVLKGPTKQGAKEKRRRINSYHLLMKIDNMLRGVDKKKLVDFTIRKGPDGEWENKDPYSWPSLNMATDRGSDCVCIDHYLAYEAMGNTNVDYDPSHDAKSVGRNTLKSCGLWSHQVPTPKLSAVQIQYTDFYSPNKFHTIL